MIEKQDNPPIMRTWKRLYTLVLVLHAVVILLFYLLMYKFSI